MTILNYKSSIKIYVLLLLIFCLFSLHSYAQEKPVMTFDETKYNFGNVQEGDVVQHTFKFKNTGKTPLLISDVKTTCGCTVPNWPQEPIAPGASNEINVKFDTARKSGVQNKVVTIVTNTEEGTMKVVLKGIVDKKK